MIGVGESNRIRRSTAAPHRGPKALHAVPGLVVTAAAAGIALVLSNTVPAIGTLTWAVVLGIAARNLRLLPPITDAGMRIATKRLLRIGVVLLGFSLSLGAIATLGVPLLMTVLVTVGAAFVMTLWVGVLLGLGERRSLLIATGFSICGASAIAAMQDNAQADDEDVAAAVGMVTVYGTAAMVVLPLLQPLLALSQSEFGAWAGASVHEVGQVIAAASPVGQTALAVAVVVKLTRVLLLAPTVVTVSVIRRRRLRAAAVASNDPRLPPMIPVFVLGFLGCVMLRTAGVVPLSALDTLSYLQTIALSAALFGLGAGVEIRKIFQGSASMLLLSMISTVAIAVIALLGVRLTV